MSFVMSFVSNMHEQKHVWGYLLGLLEWTKSKPRLEVDP